MNTQRATNENVPNTNFFETDFTIQHFQDEIKYLREEVGNRNEIIKTLLENINCLKKQFSQNQNSSYNSYKKSLKRQNQKIDNQDECSFIIPTKKIKIKSKKISIKVIK